MPASSSRARLPLIPTLCWLLWGPQALAMEAVSTAANVASASDANDISLPLKDNGFNLGEIAVRTDNTNNVSLQRGGFLAAVRRVLRPEVLATIERSLPSGEFLTLKQIDAAGLDCEYDEERLELKVNPTVEQRPRGEISGGMGGYELGGQDYAKLALVSGYLNMSLGATYDRDLGENVGIVNFPAGSFDGVVRVVDVVVEGEFDADTTGNIVRRGTRAIYDLPAEAIRVTAGDLPTSMGGGRPLPQLVGVTVEKSYQKLQPTKNVRPTGRRSFRVERPSEIQVLLNDRPVRRLQVGPGEYDLDTLPLVAGSNRVQLLIKDDAGREEKLDFSILFDRSLLSVGMSEWSVTGGVAASMDQALIYDYSRPFSSVSYRYGLLENLSAEISLEASKGAATIGASALSQTPIGFMVLDGAASGDDAKGFGFFGAADLEVALAAMTDSPSSLHFSLEIQSKGFALAGNPSSDNSAWLQARASYSRAIDEGLSAGVSARYAFGRDDGADRYGFGLTLNQSLGDGAMLGISGSYGSEPLLGEKAKLPGVSLLARLSYRIDSRSDLGLAVDPLRQRVATHAGRSVGDGVGRWSTNIEYTREAGGEGESPDNALEAGFGYIGNRFEISTSHNRNFASLQRAKNVNHSVNLGTAIAFADGTVAFGRPVRSSFALVGEHPGLEESKLRISPSDTGDAGSSDGLGPVIISELSPYTPTRVGYDFEDAPAGYDTGSGSLDFRPPYKSGHRVTVGSGQTVTASGILHDTNNRPIELLAGVAFEGEQPDRKVTVFTNAEGIFSAQGLGPGDWVIEIGGQTTYRFTFSLPEAAAGEVDLGTLTAAR